MLNFFGCCCANGRGAPQSPNPWRSCKVQGKIGEDEMEDDSGMVMGVECVKPGQDGNVELDEGGYWNVGLSTGVGGSCGVGGKVGVDGTDCR